MWWAVPSVSGCESKVYFQTADLLAWTVVIVVCSVGFEKLVLWLLRRCFAAWEGR